MATAGTMIYVDTDNDRFLQSTVTLAKFRLWPSQWLTLTDSDSHPRKIKILHSSVPYEIHFETAFFKIRKIRNIIFSSVFCSKLSKINKISRLWQQYTAILAIGTPPGTSLLPFSMASPSSIGHWGWNLVTIKF